MEIRDIKKDLLYPFDNEKLIRKKKTIKRLLLEQKNDWIEKKIAILSGSTVNEICDMMELFLLAEGIKPSFYLSEYNKYYEDAVFGNNELDSFEPDIIYIHTTSKNILNWPNVMSEEKEVKQLLKEQFSHFETIWSHLSEKFSCLIIQNNFEKPEYRLFGNLDIVEYRGRSNFIYNLNGKFYDYASKHDDFYINDIDYISSAFGLEKWHDAQYWNLYKYAMTLKAIPEFAFNLTRIIKSLYGKNKKTISLDLDNTLWGGVVGDDGVDKIEIGRETPKAEAFLSFQNYIKDVKSTGVLLTVNSKNDLENALDGLKHPEGVLKPGDFACIKANWNTKDANIKEIASILNIGIDSIVHIDDNPVEREIVASQLPMVATPDIGKAEQYIQVCDRNGFFEITKLTKDDLSRNEMYKANAQRVEALNNYESYEQFLEDLRMVATIRTFEDVYLQRIAQLTNKTNQFNLTTRRYSESEIADIKHDEKYITLYGKLEDKFGDNGVVSVLFGHQKNETVYIDLFLMSCRVLKRNFEYAMMDKFIEKCRGRNVKKVFGYYYPTAKNGMVKLLYEELGFEKTKIDEAGNIEWVIDVDSYTNKNKVIKKII